MHRHSLLLLLLATAAALTACPRGSKEPAPGPAADGAKADAARSNVHDALSDGGPTMTAEERAALVARGGELYGRMCAVCHGARGEGYVADQAPSLSHPELLSSVSDEFLRFSIAIGRQGTKMSAWQADQGGPLTSDDVTAIVTTMRSWQKTPPLALDERPPSGDREQGKVIFERECARCHGASGPYVRIRNRQWLAHASPGFIRHAIRKGRPGTEMAPFESALGEQGIEHVVTYLRSLPSWILKGEVEGTSRPPPIALGAVPLNPRGREPRGFQRYPLNTSIDVIAPELLKRKARMVLLDARAPSDYQREHIAGAVSVPFYDPSPYLADLPKDTWLVSYCGCPHAESRSLAEQLVEAGFSKVTVLNEGLDAWMMKKYPMSSGLAP
jgi:cytochrome c oxidase cbb3-type subunit 3/ubiquinol-cytochrome c reductase cytochrome c subunit